MYPKIKYYEYVHQYENCKVTDIRLLKIVQSHNAGLMSPEHLLYYREPDTSEYPLDLNVKVKNYIPQQTNLSRYALIENYLMSAMQEKQKRHPRLAINIKSINICTQRSALIKIMLTPYMHAKSGWCVVATKYAGKIYLTLKVEPKDAPAGDSTKLFNPFDAQPFRLRQYCFADTPHGKPRTDQPVNENEELFATYALKLMKLNILFSTKISGVESDVEITDLHDPDELAKCDMVLTKRATIFGKPMESYLVQRWAIQAYLIGCNRIRVGLVTSRGQVRLPVKRLTLEKLIKHKYFKLPVCVAFLNDLLEYVVQEMKGVDCPYTAYEFGFVKGSDTVSLQKHNGKNEHSYLSEEFIEFLQKQRTAA